MEDYGIKISEEGHSVFTADDKNLVLNSEWPTIMSYIDLIGTTTEALPISHGLSYSPAFITYINKNGDKSTIMVGTYDPWSIGGWVGFADDYSSYVNTTQLNVVDPGSGTYTHSYFIFSEKSTA